ncbi:MAG: hypothetical protein AB3N20_07910 [Rhizobiaceae bacterium]
MKTTNLLISVAIAGVMIANPLTAETADAAKIKIKVDASHGHNAKVKPRIRIKPKITAAKAATKVKVKRKKKGSKINPAPKPVEEAQIARVGGAKKNSKLATGASRGQSRYVELPEITDVLPTFRIDFAAASEAAEAARAAAELKDLIELGALRDAATPDFGLPTPDLARDIPSNAERLGETGFERRTGGMFPGDDLGSGPGGFGGLANSHNGKTPANPWGVNTNDIGKSVAGDYDTGWQDMSDLVPGMQVRETSTTNSDRSVTNTYHRRYAPGTIGTGIFRRTTYNEDGTVRHQRYVEIKPSGARTTTINHGDNHVIQLPPVRFKQDAKPSETSEKPDKPAAKIAKLENPDYVGGSNCNNIGCILNGGGEIKPLDGSKLTRAEVLPAGPDEDNGGISASGTPMYSANDVLERYDEDSRRRDEFRRANPDDFCFHSEC